MKTIFFALAAVLFGSAAAQAQVAVQTNLESEYFYDPTFTDTPGQAVLWNVVLQGSAGTVTGDLGSRCLLFPTLTSPTCDGPAAPMAATVDFLSPSGLSAVGTTQAGNDYAGTSFAISSGPTAVPALDFIGYNLIAADRQRLRFDVTGSDLPEFIDVDVTFSVFSEVLDNSTLASPLTYQKNSSATVQLFEAGTFPTGSSGPGFSPFRAGAFGNGAAIGETITLPVRPNEEYWLNLESQSAFYLLPNMSGVIRDYDGLDVQMSSWADPVFSLNPDFAAANPLIAANLTISRTSVVPLPGALPLFAPALFGLLALQRRGKHSPRDRGPTTVGTSAAGI